MTVYNMYKCIHGGVSYTIECNSLKAAFQPLTSSPSADSPILKYQPVLAFVLREKSYFCLPIQWHQKKFYDLTAIHM